MYFLIFTPKSFPLENSSTLKITSPIRFSKIFLLEDNLSKLNISIEKTLHEMLKKIKTFDGFTFEPTSILLEFKMNENDIDRSFDGYKEEYEKIRDEFMKARIVNKNGFDFKCEYLIFLDCLHVVVDIYNENIFKKIIKNMRLSDSTEMIGRDNSKVYYRVLCVKKEREVVENRLGIKFECIRCKDNNIKNDSTSKEMFRIPNKANNNIINDRLIDKDGKINNNNDKEKNCQYTENEYIEFVIDKIIQLSQLYLQTLFAKGCVESIGRYGSFSELKYRIVDLKKKEIKKYLTKIKKNLKLMKIIDDFSDEEEYPFTHYNINVFNK